MRHIIPAYSTLIAFAGIIWCLVVFCPYIANVIILLVPGQSKIDYINDVYMIVTVV